MPIAAQDAPLAEAPTKLADPRSLGVEERRSELKKLRQKIAALQARYQATKKREADTKAALEAASLNLQIKTAERRLLEIRQAESEKAASSALSDRNAAKERTDQLRHVLRDRLRALYRMGRSGYLRTLSAVDSGPMFLRGLQLLSYMTRRDSELLRQYEKSLEDLGEREFTLKKEREEFARIVLEARQKEQELAAAQSEKITLLSQLQRASVDDKKTLTRLEDKASRLEALLMLLESRGKALPPGAENIRRYKGVLDWPLKGKVLIPFGRVANPHFPGTFLRSSGWTIQALRGAQVRAIFPGDVVYAQWLKGYGNMVVIDHGDGVFSLYGRLLPATAARGTRLALGDPVGQVGDSTEEEAAGLYFEIRESRQSSDPRLWLR